MSEPWTREHKFLVCTFVVGLITAGAALAVIPEVRHFFRLDQTHLPLFTTNNDAQNSPPSPPTPPSPDKIAGLAIEEGPIVNLDAISVQLLEIAAYGNGSVYIKLRLCNTNQFSTASFPQLHVWYTPPDQESITWEFPDTNKATRPGECHHFGRWNETPLPSFELKRPLGILHMSTPHTSYGWLFNRLLPDPTASIDLNLLDSQEKIRM